MNVVFMGTPEFAVPSLCSLATSTHKIAAVVTQPDRPRGRSKTPCPSPVKEKAQALGLKILQPVNINDEPVVKQLQCLSPDCIVVVALIFMLLYCQNFAGQPLLIGQSYKVKPSQGSLP
jgi:methionyl-tRNA formyltransferase